MSQSNVPLAPSNDGVPPMVGTLPVARPLTAGPPPALPTARLQAAKAAVVGNEADDLPPLADMTDYLAASPAWLLSAIVHMLLVIFLGLLFIAQETTPKFVLSLSVQDDGGEDFAPGDLDVPIDLNEPVLEPSDALSPAQLAAINPTEDLAAAIAAPPAPVGLEVTADSPAIEMALTGREAGMKESLLRAYGGTSSTETAVTQALLWLVRNQGDNSLWSLTGKYANGANTENREAATAMALLAFQGAGYTPQSDRKEPFTAPVTKAWSSLLKRQGENGNFFKDGAGNTRLYTQALCTIALCELYGMTRDPQYREPAQRAVDYCVKIQAPEGGWRYQPGVDSDLSVTGWFVMALQSARMAGLDVPSPTLGRVGDFLDMVAHDGGAQYGYVPNQGKKLSMTAEGLLCRQYLGWGHDDERLKRGVRVLTRNLPTADRGETHVYYWYYATQVCHHMEGESWRQWNEVMRETLPMLQIRDGRERGSWDPTVDTTVGVVGGGRLFVTCLATYMLEVYYRHLPIYQLDALHTGY